MIAKLASSLMFAYYCTTSYSHATYAAAWGAANRLSPRQLFILRWDCDCHDHTNNITLTVTLEITTTLNKILIVMSSLRDSEIQRLTQRLLAAEQRTQKTTLNEYLQACHEHLHKPLRVETNKSWTSKGVPRPGNRYYPKVLKEWGNLAGEQQKVFSKACDIFHPKGQSALRLFSPNLSVEDQGRLHCNIRIANEASLRTYEKSAIEVQVADIISRLSEIVQDSEEFELGQGIIFENDPNSLSEMAEEVQERLHAQRPRTLPPIVPPSTSCDSSDLGPGLTRADQYCTYKNVGGERQLLFIVEYKPPHKLSIGNLSRFRPMDVKKEVMDRIDIPPPVPTDKTEEDAEQSGEERAPGQAANAKAIEDRLQYNADKVFMAVATQTFHYMIENGLEYSYVTTGEAFVFLHINWKDPTTLLYHVTVPTDEANDDGSDFPYSQTAIGQVLGLCLMSFKSEQRDHARRQDAKKQLEKHPVTSLETIVLQTPASERKLAAGKKRAQKSPLYKGGKKVPVTSEYSLRSKKCEPGDLPKNFDDEQDDPDGPNSLTRPSASSSGRRRGKSDDQRKSEGRNSSNQASSSHGAQRQYCTQRCFLGIVRGSSLDKNCPNASLHGRRGRKHAVDQSKFLDLVQKQLTEDLDHNCDPLGLQGARGALFKVTLASHGYVFVGKGTVQAFVPDLRHEGDVYRRLEKLQGAVVPVCLGNIDLTEWYYLDVGVRILHMLLMSWGGNLAGEDESMKDSSELNKEIKRTVTEVRRAGVDQMDVRPPNLLWNREAQRVMLIDFERAAMAQCELQGTGIHEERVMQEISPNKRRKRTESQLSGAKDEA